MSKTKQKYYELKKQCDDGFGGLHIDIVNYVNELEKQNEKMIEFLLQVYKRLKAIETKDMWSTVKIDLLDKVKIESLLEKITGKTIEEVLSEQ